MARHGARQVAIAALAIIGGVGIGAQNPQPAPTFRSEIDYVQIPVRVLDARGQFVHGLTQSDFQILEDGVPQTITAFSGRLRQQVDLNELTAELLAVVEQTMQPSQASLWLRSPKEPSRTP